MSRKCSLTTSLGWQTCYNLKVHLECTTQDPTQIAYVATNYEDTVVSLHEGAKTNVGVDCESSQEFEVKVGMHQGSVLSPFLLAVVVIVVTEFVRGGALSEMLYADDSVLMIETIKGLGNKCLKWMEALESKS